MSNIATTLQSASVAESAVGEGSPTGWAQFQFPGGGVIELIEPIDAAGFVQVSTALVDRIDF